MKTPAAVVALVLLAAPAAHAQFRASVSIDLPVVVAPRLVVVQPGIQVVEDYDEEIFFVDGWYWVRRDAGWYRTRDCRHPRWAMVERRHVPPRVVRMPPGQYRRYRKAEEKAWKRHEKAHEKAWERREKGREKNRERREKAAAKEHERRMNAHEHRRDHDHGHGHGGFGRRHHRD